MIQDLFRKNGVLASLAEKDISDLIRQARSPGEADEDG